MTRFLLDSGIVLRHLRGQPAVTEWLHSLSSQGRLGLSSITRLEVHAAMQSAEAELTQKLLNRLLTYPPTPAVADRAGDYIREYQQQRINLSAYSALIAATAVTHHLTLVTLSPQAFPMPELTLLPLPAALSRR
jgi:predicted nucleic acid-binding protein